MDWLTPYSPHYDDLGRLAHVSHALKEYQAFEQGAALVPLLSSTPLKLEGPDRHDFLHGQLSHDVKGLHVGQGNSSLMLNVKGHALAQLRVYRREDELFVVVEQGAGPLVKAHLERHIIFDDVRITDLKETLTHFTLQGPQSAEVLARCFPDYRLAPDTQPSAWHHAPFDDAQVLISPVKRSMAGGADVYVLIRSAPTLVQALIEAGATLAGEQALRHSRIVAGIAHAATEGGEGILPQEAGLEPLVSYHKGCYLGQEIMARIEARGQVRRGLMQLRLTAMPEDQRIMAQGKQVGKLGTMSTLQDDAVLALAVVRHDAAPPFEIGSIAATLL